MCSMRVMVLGATGMLGNAIFHVLSSAPKITVFGTVRNSSFREHFHNSLWEQIIVGIDAENNASLVKAFSLARPDVVINCIGLVKQLEDAHNPLKAIHINALFPHKLAELCRTEGARLIHISTDCVFSGSTGNYKETDHPDARDLYGHSKLLGEVDYPHTITLRTSIIGHELSGAHSLVNWFLAQRGSINGFTQAIFSGLTANELANIIKNVVMPKPDMHGLYHVAAKPINKFDLLRLIAKIYEKNIEIIPKDDFIIDSSLNAQIFQKETGYTPPEWPVLIHDMHEFYLSKIKTKLLMYQ